MSWATILGVAKAEARLIRRQARFWVFTVIGALVGGGIYLYYAALHGLFSSFSATVGTISPKYLVSGMGLYYFYAFLIGIVLLSFDVRARDERERVAEVLDSRPFNNLEMLFGRFIGVVGMVWLAMAVIFGLLQVVGWLLDAAGSPIGGTMEPRSWFGLIFLIAIPGFAFITALVFLISVVFRRRLVSALISLVALGLILASNWLLPFAVIQSVDILGNFSQAFPSEIVPKIFGPGGAFQRFAVLLAAVGFLFLAAALHPRSDGGSRKMRGLIGLVILGLGVAGLGALWFNGKAYQQRQATWLEAHLERVGEVSADLQTIRGEIDLDPGKSLGLDLELTLSGPAEGATNQALFSLNPALEISRVADGNGREVPYRHEMGLLELELPRSLGSGDSLVVALSAAGNPDVDFGYMDGAKDIASVSAGQSQIALLGFDKAVFDRRHVDLMPRIAWLPLPGPNVARDDPARQPRDLFEVDLTVTVPGDWLVAGPGKRHDAGAAGDGRARFRFTPGAPLPEVALVGGEFVSRRAEVRDVTFEILVIPSHTANLDLFADAQDEILGWIDEKLEEAERLGLPYPYDGLTLVEVPTTLRGYAGGWRLDTTLAQPGMILMRESSLPTSRFERRFEDTEELAEREGGIGGAKRDVLRRFFVNDFSGGNVMVAASRNFFEYQVAASGNDAVALSFASSELVNQLVVGEDGFFSAHVFDSGIGQVVNHLLTNFFGGGQKSTIAASLVDAVTQRPSVWGRIERESLVDLDLQDKPKTAVNALILKGGAMARWLRDELGDEKVGAVLAELRAQHAGGTFSRADLVAAAGDEGERLEALLNEWVDQTALPGIVAAEPVVKRLADVDGQARYQVTLALANPEAVSGLVRLEVLEGEEDSEWVESDPARVAGGEAVEIGVVVSRPPSELLVRPYLAKNRSAFKVSLPRLDLDEIDEESEPFDGSRPTDWRPRSDAVIVDDLDPGFSFEDPGRSGFRLGGRSQDPDLLDQGMPEYMFGPATKKWSRRSVSGAYGQYRKTVSLLAGGDGSGKAIFSAEAPRSGRYRLAIHLGPMAADDSPMKALLQLGVMHLSVESDGATEPTTFDASEAEEGWNEVGEFELSEGPFKVVLTDETTGAAVWADAIRMEPVGRARIEAETNDG